MPANVVLQLGLAHKSFLANGALVRSFARVHGQVELEFVPATKRLLADRTGEALHVVVDLHVAPETRGRKEPVAADLAQERFEEVVKSRLVVGQVDLLDEALATLVAAMRGVLPLVGQDHMFLQGVVELELTGALGAGKGILVGVHLGLVRVQGFPSVKGTLAQVTLEGATLAFGDVIFHAVELAIFFVAIAANKSVVRFQQRCLVHDKVTFGGRFISLGAGMASEILRSSETFVAKVAALEGQQ